MTLTTRLSLSNRLVNLVPMVFLLLFTIVSSGCSDSTIVRQIDRPDNDIDSLQISPAISELPLGTQQQYILTAFNHDGTNRVLTNDPSVVWQIDQPDVAAIDASTGVVTTLATGTATISASYGDNGRQLSTEARLTVTNAVVTALQITPAAESVPAGVSTSYTATAFFSDGTSLVVNQHPQLTWRVDEPSLASIDEQGNVTTTAAGSLNVTAEGTINGQTYSATVPLEITEAVLSSLQLLPDAAVVPIGLSQQYQAIGFFSDGSSEDLTDEQGLSWQLSNSAIAQVDDNGLLTAHSQGDGQVQISFTDGDTAFSASAEFGVSPAVPTVLQLTPQSIALPSGLTTQMTATAFFSDGDAKDVTSSAQLNWQINDPTVATIDADGRLTALTAGNAEVSIFANYNGVELHATAEIAVTNAVVTGLRITPERPSVPAGLTQQLIATAFHSDGHSINVTDDSALSWQVDDLSIATVSADGVITALKPGTATISARGISAGEHFSATAELTVTDALVSRLEIAPNSVSTPAGLSQQAQAIAHFSDGSLKDVSDDPALSWQVKDVLVAKVDGSGIVTGVATGATELMASGQANGVDFSASIPVTVTQAVVTGLQLTPSDDDIPAGLSKQMSSIAFASNGVSVDVSSASQISWQVDDTSIATVTQSGLVTGLTEGEVVVSAHGSTNQGRFDATALVTVIPAQVTAIQVTPTDAKLPNGLSRAFSAVAFMTDGRSVDISEQPGLSWQVDDSDIASIDSNGVLRAHALGNVVVTATIDVDGTLYSDSTSATIIDAVITELQITPALIALPAGASIQYHATAFMSDGSSLNLTDDPALQWNVIDRSVAVISADGLLTAITNGRSQVTAIVIIEGIQFSTIAQVEVTDAIVTALEVEPADLALPLGLSANLTATATYTNGDRRNVSDHSLLSWQVSDTAIATIDNQSGQINATGIGTVTVTATLLSDDGTIQGQTDVQVTEAIISQLHVSPATRTVVEGSNQQFLALATFTDGSRGFVTDDPSVNWSIDNTDVASLGDRPGRINTLAAGQVQVTAFAKDGSNVSDSTALTVTAASIDRIEISPTDATVALGFSQRFNATALYDNGTIQDITTDESAQWRVSDTKIATINPDNATVTGIKPGVVDVTVTVIDQQTTHTASATLTVNKAGNVLSWGDASSGGDSSIIEDELMNVKTVVANETNFAAIKNDGTILAWGDCPRTTVRIESNGIKQLVASSKAFSALREDGTVVLFGSTVSSGDPDSPNLHDQSDCLQIEAGPTYITQMFANVDAFAAIKVDGTVATWGDPQGGGDSSSVQAELVDVIDIVGSGDAFAAIREDGSVVTWGEAEDGGDSSAVAAELINVESISASPAYDQGAFVALKSDRTVVFWGAPRAQASYDAVRSQLVNIKTVYQNEDAFAALTYDGNVITWGDSGAGGDSSAAQPQLNQVTEIVPSRYAFAALKADGSVVAWGSNKYGGDASAVQASLSNVDAITATSGAFAAVTSDHRVITWGQSYSGGDSTGVDLTFVREVYANFEAFTAIKLNGEVVTWGWNESGGDSSGVDFSNTRTIFSHHNGLAFSLLKE